MVIEAHQLRKAYGDLQALKGIDIGIEAGGIVGILGPNGAGKTTLVEIFEGLRVPTGGRVSVLGIDPAGNARRLKQRIGVQLQNTSIPNELTAGEVLRLYAAFYEKSVPVESVLEQVQLVDKAKTRTAHLSGGQKQRLAIGMALVNAPELIILDEPTSGLDPIARRNVHDIISHLRSQGRTVLLTTHYIEEAEKLCDRVIMIKDGEIVADGSPFELVGQATGATTIWIAVDGAFDPAPLVKAGVEPQGREGQHYRFSTTDPAAAVIALGQILQAQQVTLTDLRMRRPTLEDVYISRIGTLPEEQQLH